MTTTIDKVTTMETTITMTALERADRIIAQWIVSDDPSLNKLRDAIERAITEHSNEELERRRKMEALVKELLDLCDHIGSLTYGHRARITKALEGDK